jgi:hypothetical protein
MFVYFGTVKPYVNGFLNKLEMFNEVCILLATYHLFAFTEFIENPETQFLMGWSLIVVTVLNLVVNMLIIVIKSLSQLVALIKKMI